MGTIQTRVLSRACRVRDFVVEHDVSGDLAELTGVSHDHDETLGQHTADATAAEAITTQSCVQTTGVKGLRLALSERQRELIVWTTHSSKREINGDDVAFVLPPCVANSERVAAPSDAMATTSNAMATVLTVLGLHFIARGLASNVLAAAPSSFTSGSLASVRCDRLAPDARGLASATRDVRQNSRDACIASRESSTHLRWRVAALSNGTERLSLRAARDRSRVASLTRRARTRPWHGGAPRFEAHPRRWHRRDLTCACVVHP